MIFETVSREAMLSQGDIIDDCPVCSWRPTTPSAAEHHIEEFTIRAMVLTQTCDVAQGKSDRLLVAVVHDAQRLVERGVLKGPMIRDSIRNHRVYGWYFLPSEGSLPESVIDLRDLHTVPRRLLDELILHGNRRLRLLPPFREHLAQHFAMTYARIALPEPYLTKP